MNDTSINIAVVGEYPVLLDDINKMITEYQSLTVVSGDTASYKEARAACTMLVHTRTRVEARRKDLLREYREQVNQVADALLAPLTPVENRLKAELKAEDDRKAAIKAELEAIEKKRVNAIKASIFELVNYANAQGKTAEQIGKRIAAIESHVIGEETYQEFMTEAILARATTLKTLRDALAEREKVEREEAAHKAEAERLERIRLEQEAENKRLEAERTQHAEELRQARLKIEAAEKRLAEEQRKIEAEKAAIEAAKQPAPEVKVSDGPPVGEQAPEVQESSLPPEDLIFETDKENLLYYFNVIWNVKKPELQTLLFDHVLSEFVSALNKYKQIVLETKND